MPESESVILQPRLIRAYKFIRKSPLYKLINAVLCELSLILKSPKAFGYPYKMIIEPTNICNLKCPLCHTGAGTLKRPKGNMSFETFKKIIDEAEKYLLKLWLVNYGEPLINKDIYHMISYAKQKKIQEVMVGSNGLLFRDKEDIRRLILSGLDILYVTLDGASQETYLNYRKGGDFQKVVSNLRDLVIERKKMNKSNPYIELHFIVMKHNEHEIPKIRELADEIGVDCLYLKPLSFNNADWNDTGVLEKFRMYRPENEDFQLYKINSDEIRWKEEIKNSCKVLWRCTVVLWDGTVVPCCLDPRGELKMGNGVKDTIKAIWNGERYHGLRQQVLKDKKKILLCSKCVGME